MRDNSRGNFSEGGKPAFKKSFGEGRPFQKSFGEKPAFKKSFGNDRPPFKKSFDKGGKFDNKPFDKGRGFSGVNTISTFKACVIRLEKISRDSDDGYALEETFLGLMKHFPLAVFGYAADNEISLVLDLNKGEVYGNSVEKTVSVAASVASVAFTKAMDDGHAYYFCGILIQPFKDKLIAYLEERQAKFGEGLVAIRSESGIEIGDAPAFEGSYLAEKLKNIAEERKDGLKPREDYKPRSFEDRPKKDFSDRKTREGFKPRSFEDRPKKDFSDRKPREFSDSKPSEYDRGKKGFKPAEKPKAKDKIGFIKKEKVGYVSDTSNPGAIKFRSFADVDTTKSKGFLERQAKRDAASKK